eukprot:scaffold7374_cov112-Isochrysis_galbana.AAC.15
MANLVYEGRVEVRGHKVDGEAGLPDPPEAGPFKRITEREKHGAKVEVGPVDALRAVGAPAVPADRRGPATRGGTVATQAHWGQDGRLQLEPAPRSRAEEGIGIIDYGLEVGHNVTTDVRPNKMAIESGCTLGLRQVAGTQGDYQHRLSAQRVMI